MMDGRTRGDPTIIGNKKGRGDPTARNKRLERISAARINATGTVDRERTKAILRAAGAGTIDDSAVEATAVLMEEKLISLAARAVESSEERGEIRLSASSVAVAAQREAEARD